MERSESVLAAAVDVAAALESYAYEYSRSVNALHFRRSRKVVVNFLLENLRSHSNVLDINCGTGVDIVEIAKCGHKVDGLDISSTMIRFADENIEREHLKGMATAAIGDYRRIEKSYWQKYDAVLSNFGGINFCRDLKEFFSSVANVTVPGGVLVLNSVSHFSISEFLIFASKGKTAKAFRRLAGGTARIGGREVQLYYHRKGALIAAASEFGFKLACVFGLNIFAPPLWADDFYADHRFLAKLLEKTDAGARSIPLLRACGDFMVLSFRKTG